MQLRRFTLRLIVSVVFLLSTFICPVPVSAQRKKIAEEIGKLASKGSKGDFKKWSKLNAGYSTSLLRLQVLQNAEKSFYLKLGSSVLESPSSSPFLPQILRSPVLESPSLSATPHTFNDPFPFPEDQYLEPFKMEDIEPRYCNAVLEALYSIPYISICGTWCIMKHKNDPMAKILLIRENPILADISEYNNVYIVISSDRKIVLYRETINQDKDTLFEGELPEVPLPNEKVKNANWLWLPKTMIAIDVNKGLLDSPESFHDSNGKDFQPQLPRPEGADVTPTSNFDNADKKEDLEEYQPAPLEKESINVILREFEKGIPSIHDYQDGNETKDVFRLKISPSEGIGTGFVKIENSRYDSESQRAA